MTENVTDDKNLFVVAVDPDTGGAVCSCGASCGRAGLRRFLTRHPGKCSERRRIAMELSRGTRCIDGDERVGRGGRVGIV